MEVQEFCDSYQNRLFYPCPKQSSSKWLLWMKSFSKTFYKTYPIKKPNNRGVRWIEAPETPLKLLQRNLIWLFDQFPRHPAAHGLDKKDYKKNALVHQDSKFLFSLDLKDFYKSCTLGQLNKSISSQDVKTAIETYKQYIFYATDAVRDADNVFLATGSPLSPIIANLAVTDIDYDMQHMANAYGAKYSRYLDDMNFSFREDIGYDLKREFMRSVIDRVQIDNWPVNIRKTKWVNPQEDAVVVTGVDLRSKPKVTRRYIVNKMRPALNEMAMTIARWNYPGQYFVHPGVNSCFSLIQSLDANVGGSLAYIRYVSENQYQQLIDYFIKRLDKAYDYLGQDIQSPLSSEYAWKFRSEAKRAIVRNMVDELKKGDLPLNVIYKVATSQFCQRDRKTK